MKNNNSSTTFEFAYRSLGAALVAATAWEPANYAYPEDHFLWVTLPTVTLVAGILGVYWACRLATACVKARKVSPLAIPAASFGAAIIAFATNDVVFSPNCIAGYLLRILAFAKMAHGLWQLAPAFAALPKYRRYQQKRRDEAAARQIDPLLAQARSRTEECRALLASPRALQHLKRRERRQLVEELAELEAQIQARVHEGRREQAQKLSNEIEGLLRAAQLEHLPDYDGRREVLRAIRREK